MKAVRHSCKTVSICIATILLVLLAMLTLFTVSVSAETAAGKAGEETAIEVAAESTPKSGWQKDDGGWKYADEDGNYFADEWSKINDRWYHFSESGYMQHGWIKDNDRWYYLGWPEDAESGAMRHGWVKLDDRWYYFGSPDNADSGAMRHGWFKDNDKWYYMGWADDDESGAMRTGWVKLGEQWYYFGRPEKADSGNMLHGWAELNEKWYYFGRPDDTETGAMRHGWLELEDAWYYLGHPDNDETGAMVTGAMNTRKADEEAKYYYFDDNGAWKEICRNVSQDETDWVVIKGVATEVVTESDRTLYRAMDILMSITTDDMTDDEKLRAAFDHIRDDYVEFNPRLPHDRSWNWAVIYANDIFVGTGEGRTGRKGGNCLSCAAAFGYLAKAIGYEEVYVCNTGHAWVELFGKVYDPEWERHNSGSYFARSLDASDGPGYKGAIDRSTISASYFTL